MERAEVQRHGAWEPLRVTQCDKCHVTHWDKVHPLLLGVWGKLLGVMERSTEVGQLHQVCPQSAESWERLVQEQREGGAFPLTRWGEKGDPSTSSPQHTNTLSPPPSPAYLGQQLDKQLTQKSCVFAQELLELQLKPVGKCFNLS